MGQPPLRRGGRLGGDRQVSRPGGSPLPKQTRIERGRAAFAKTVADYKARRFVFTADDEAIEDDLIFVEALNLGMTGPRMIIGPTAQPGDQLLDIVYLPAVRRQ